LPWRAALTLGVLLNTRGLVELIVLNAGYELNLISAKLFTVLVVMALATTLMTYPLLQGLKRKESVTAGCD
jgi:Kef-type K+ transport system membrane component KefB